MDSLAARNIVFARGLKKNPLIKLEINYATSPKSVWQPSKLCLRTSAKGALALAVPLDVLGQHRFNAVFWMVANELIYHFSIFKKHQCWNSAHAVSDRCFLIAIDVHFANFHFAIKLESQLFELWR